MEIDWMNNAAVENLIETIPHGTPAKEFRTNSDDDAVWKHVGLLQKENAREDFSGSVSNEAHMSPLQSHPRHMSARTQRGAMKRGR